MKLSCVHIHNFRGIVDQSFHLNDYTLLVGSNNSGKSTIVDALRAFYEKDKFAFSDSTDFPKKGAEDEESWLEISYELSDAEYLSLAEQYRVFPNKLTVKKFFRTAEQLSDGRSAKGCIVGLVGPEKYAKEAFYGAKNVQNGKLGNIIYIPAISLLN